MTRKPKKQWEQHHTATLYRLNALGLDDAMIAQHTGHDVDTVQRRRSALGLPTCYEVKQAGWEALPGSAIRAIEKQIQQEQREVARYLRECA